MTVQVYYYKTYNSMSNDYNIIHLNGTSGGYQSDNLTRVTAVIVATRHKQLYVPTYEYNIKSWKISTRVNASLRVFFPKNVGIQKISITGHRCVFIWSRLPVYQEDPRVHNIIKCKLPWPLVTRAWDTS